MKVRLDAGCYSRLPPMSHLTMTDAASVWSKSFWQLMMSLH